MKWTLIYEAIYEEGYSRKLRKRLLRVRNHLVQNEAFEYAAQLTLSIAALDASHEKPGVLTFLYIARSGYRMSSPETRRRGRAPLRGLFLLGKRQSKSLCRLFPLPNQRIESIR
jgi:hypothetical protein